MKLARFDDNRIGIVKDDQIFDVTDIVDGRPSEWPPVGMLRLIASFADYRPRLEAATRGKEQGAQQRQTAHAHSLAQQSHRLSRQLS